MQAIFYSKRTHIRDRESIVAYVYVLIAQVTHATDYDLEVSLTTFIDIMYVWIHDCIKHVAIFDGGPKLSVQLYFQ
jgi:hypothetical protein